MVNVSTGQAGPGVCNYTFTLPCGPSGTTLSWAAAESEADAVALLQPVLRDPAGQSANKTAHMNSLLNEAVPYFRCSDQDVVKLYYYLWSLFLMYTTPGGGAGMQRLPHTQTAVNNFLGLHRCTCTCTTTTTM